MRGIDNSLITGSFDMEYIEEIDLKLRSLYRNNGYTRFKMGKFEEYDLYTRNRNFIPNEKIITVTGQKGKLLALRPDLTLSIVKYFRPEETDVERLYYSENIYRSEKNGDYQEIHQTGLELLGKVSIDEISEVALLAAESIKMISKDFILEISHMGFIQEITDVVPDKGKKDILKAISEKNIAAIDLLGEELEISANQLLLLKEVALTYGPYKSVLQRLKKLSLSDKAQEYLTEISEVCDVLSRNKFGSKVNIDFSIVNNLAYYSGILFQGYIQGVPKRILSGGRYDKVLEGMGKAGGAIGFAIYLDALDEIKALIAKGKNSNKSIKSNSIKDGYINVALPKGRLGNKIYDMFEKAGYPCLDIKDDNRKLVFENKATKIRYFWVKPSDVTVYVERGTADIGACGKDIIEEYSPDIYELLDLKKGKCKVCVAAKSDFEDDTSKVLRVATKFPEIAKKYFERQSRNIDIIKLHGSIELAPVLDMSDVIVDIVETGKTLRENDLLAMDTVLSVSARLIANKSSFKFKNKRIAELTDRLQNCIKE